MTAIPTTPDPAGRFAAPVAFVAAFAAIVFAANFFTARGVHWSLDLPHAQWSGVLEIEIKLKLLEQFAREGPVDAIVVSSSLGDYGISAQTLTGELSRRYGRPFRVFNFSTGGADIPTYPMLYRLARLAAKPKEVWVAAPVSAGGGGNEFDRHMLVGPFSRWDRLPGLLRASRAAYEIPLVRFAPVIRDILLNAHFPERHLPDTYPINAFGDTVSWLHVADQYALAPANVAQRRAQVLGFENGDAAAHEKYLAFFFGPRAIEAIERLREEAARDEARVVVVALDYATSMAGRDPAYARGEARYFERLAREYGGTVVNAMPDFSPDAYMIQDLIHLNTIGAREFSAAIAARMAGASAPAQQRFAAPPISASEKGWSVNAMLIPKSAKDPAASLALQLIQNFAVAQLRPHPDMALQVRMPDGRDFFAPARVVNGATVVADCSGIPFTAEDQVVRAQLVVGQAGRRLPLGITLYAFRWSSQADPPPFDTEPFEVR